MIWKGRISIQDKGKPDMGKTFLEKKINGAEVRSFEPDLVRRVGLLAVSLTIVTDVFPPLHRLAAKMLTFTGTDRKNGEIFVVGKIQLFWASTLHYPTLPQSQALRHA